MSNKLEFEAAISELVRPLNGQLPRPWMTDLEDPLSSNIFIVGMNQRNGYDVAAVGSVEHHIACLFNRPKGSCRSLYEEITGGKPSQTRSNIDRLRASLEQAGLARILETNVICYSTPMSADLGTTLHEGGSGRGEEIFRYLLVSIEPLVLIVHGSSASKRLGKILGASLPSVPASPEELDICIVGERRVAVIPSLAPPAYNRWCRWSDDLFKTLADQVVALV